MKLREFQVGSVFYTASSAWVCTDIGSRVVIAVNQNDLNRMPEGPPYAVDERVFDEYDQQGCLHEPWPQG